MINVQTQPYRLYSIEIINAEKNIIYIVKSVTSTKIAGKINYIRISNKIQIFC